MARRLMSLCGRLSASSVDSLRNADMAATLDTATYSRSAVMCESVSTRPSDAAGAAAERGLDAASIRSAAPAGRWLGLAPCTTNQVVLQ